VSWQFSDSCRSVEIVTGEAKFSASDLIRESLVQAVITSEGLRHLVLSIDLMRLSSRNDSNLFFLSGKRAGQLADQFERCVWRGFFVVRIGEA
jgi:hypothetical protein